MYHSIVKQINVSKYFFHIGSRAKQIITLSTYVLWKNDKGVKIQPTAITKITYF